MHYLFISALLFLSQLSYCSSTAFPESVKEQEAGIGDPDPEQVDRRREAVRAAWRSQDWQLAISAETEQDRAVLFQLASEIAKQKPDDKELTVVDLAELSTAERYRLPTLILGNKLPPEIWTMLGGDSQSNYRGYDLTRPNWLLQAFYLENPWSSEDTSMAMNLVYATNAAQLVKSLRSNYASSNYRGLFRGQYGYLVDEGNEARLRGFFNDASWRPDAERELRFEAAGNPIYLDSTVHIFAPDGAPGQQTLNDVARRLSRHSRQLADILGIDDKLPPLELHIYPNLERITLRRKTMQEIQYDDEGHVLHLSIDDYQRTLQGSETNYCLLQWLKKVKQQRAIFPEAPYLERGLATLLTFPSSVHYPTQALTESGLLLKAAAFKTTDRSEYGAYLYDYAAALLCRDYILSKKQNTPLGSPAVADQDLATSLVNNLPLSVLGTLKTSATQPTNKKFQRGMTFAHEGYQVINGYGGTTVLSSLDSLSKLSVNSLAVVPYTFQRDPTQVAALPVSDSPGGENNGATRNSIRQAHRRGWTVMLKPQIWVGRNSWPGDIDMPDEAAWEEWFENYSAWMLNYALMAEEEGVASLCIGTELRHTTLKQPDRWRKLIRLIRSVYRGKLTYAANWGDEFEKLSFWDELDVIGLNAYYPLSDQENPTDEELLRGAQRWVGLAERVATEYKRPWWLTEVGFRSVENTWVNPHTSTNGRKMDYQAQTRSFRSMIKALTEAAPQLNGMYVWKWPSYLDRDNPLRRQDNTGFTPAGKPAAKVLAAYYKSIAAQE